MDKLKVRLVTPDKARSPIEVDYLRVITSNGQVEIFPHHESYLANVDTSILTVCIDGAEKHYAVDGGCVRMDNATNTCTLLLSSIVDARDIVKAQALKEKNDLEKRLKSAESNEEHEKVRRELRRIINILDIGDLYKE